MVHLWQYAGVITCKLALFRVIPRWSGNETTCKRTYRLLLDASSMSKCTLQCGGCKPERFEGTAPPPQTLYNTCILKMHTEDAGA